MERAQVLKVLVPVAAVAGLLFLVGVVIALTSGDTKPTEKPPVVSTPPDTPGTPSIPKFTFALDGPEWKDAGDGLKIWDVTEGSGTPAPEDCTPSMHYTGWLTDGTPFDGSKPKGKPLEMPLRRLIQGWQRGVPGMKPGGVRRLIVPSELGYGAGGQGKIPGNATLVFEMELIAVH